MAGVRFDVFKGIRPRVAKRLLPAGEAQAAENCMLGSGHLEPWPGPEEVPNTSTFNAQTIYRMRNGGDPKWLQFSAKTDVVRGPVPDDELERTYYTGAAQPRMTTTALVGDSDPLPEDYRYLGIPAPDTAPTVSGEALPASAVTGTTEGFATPSLKADFTIDQNLPAEVNSWYMALTDNGVPSDNGYEPEGVSRTYRFDVPVGLRLRVASVVDENTITIEDEDGSGFVFAGTDDSRSGQTWWRTEDTGTTRAGYFRFYMPSGTKVTITGHGLKEGDVIRVTAVPSPIAITFTMSGPVTKNGGHFFGWESDNTGGSESTNTWPSAPTSAGEDSFFIGGSRSYPFVDIFVDQDGAGSSGSFEIDGQFSFQLVERDGVAYDDIVADIESRVYVYTFVSDLGEEGPPSPESNVVTIPTGGSVTVGSFAVPPSDKRNITNIRIYRANTGSEATEFQFVAEIDSPFDDYLDEVADIALGEVLQTTSWEPPPTDLTGLVSLPNGVLAGFVGKTVYFSEPYYPHAWPPEYKIAVDHDIVGLGVLPNGVAILTAGPAYVAAGDHPRSMSLRHFTASQACVSKSSIVSTIDSVLYASPDGLASIGARGFELLTEKHAKKREWQEFDPTNLLGFWHDNRYFGFNLERGFVFDPFDDSIGLTELDFTIKCGFVDVEEDILYGVPQGDGAFSDVVVLMSFDGADGSTTFTDDSNYAHAFTMGAATIDTAQSKFGGASALFDGSSNSYIAHAGAGAEFDMSDDDFTIEFFVRFDEFDVGNNGIFGLSASSVQHVNSYYLRWNATSKTQFIYYLASAPDSPVTWTIGWDPALDTWYHVALVRHGGTLYFFVNGEKFATHEIGASAVFNFAGAGVAVFSIGEGPISSGGPMHGWIDEFRLTIGTARYIDTFTPPTEAFPREDDSAWDASKIYKLFVDTAAPLTFTWRSADMVLPYPLNPAAARVIADSYPVTFTLYDRDGTVRHTRSVASDSVFRLPGGYTTDVLSVGVEADAPVRMVHIAETVEELFSG